jgi:prefoldin subunit 5
MEALAKAIEDAQAAIREADQTLEEYRRTIAMLTGGDYE